MATKSQYGWPGFTAPYATRYLTKLVVITTTPYNLGSPFPPGPPIVRQQLWQVDRITGLTTIPADLNSAQADADFPYGLPLRQDQNESWEVTETYFKHFLNAGDEAFQTEVTLSNPYDLATLEADTNALLSSVSVLNMPWNTLQTVSDYGVSYPGDLTQLLPPQVTYPNIYAPGPISIPQLNAAAWSIYAPGGIDSTGWWGTTGYNKLIGYFAMTGKYCQKTYTIDYAQNLLSQICASGVGSCGAPFKVSPPSGITPGQDTYVIITPNCQCGG